MRTFIAVELPANIQKQVHDVQLQLHTYLHNGQIPACIHWAPVAKIHLTLRFLGETSQTQQASLGHQLRQMALNQPVFTLSLGQLGCFPHFRKPNVIWLDVGNDGVVLQQLQAQIEQAAQMAGFAPESRPFSPHITLGRTRRASHPVALQRTGEALKNFQRELAAQRRASVGFDPLVINQIVHMQSELRPEGALYTPLTRYPLG